ncbi:F-box protein [Legionella sainthelensi]|uniref:F-box protein n=1 Tax=Legionella sainthelensi TaxID=28087 RepID=UPI000E208113|nr:F-box protein [Legionella sainthelensi]
MYNKSLGDSNCNYFDNLPQELFNIIVNDLPYDYALASLSMTSKNLRRQVLNSPCGETVEQLKVLISKSSYMNDFLGANYTSYYLFYCGTYIGASLFRSYFISNDISSYLAATGCGIIGGITSFAIAGYNIDGIEGMKKGIYAYASAINPTPWLKLGGKLGCIIFNGLLSTVSQRDTTILKDLIKESPKQLSKQIVEGFDKLSFFKEAKKDLHNKIYEKKIELLFPIK